MLIYELFSANGVEDVISHWEQRWIARIGCRQRLSSVQWLWLAKFGISWVTWVVDGENRPWRHWRVEFWIEHCRRSNFDRNTSGNEKRRYVDWQKHNGDCSRSARHRLFSPRRKKFDLTQEFERVVRTSNAAGHHQYSYRYNNNENKRPSRHQYIQIRF